jgi:hypothetical protein
MAFGLGESLIPKPNETKDKDQRPKAKGPRRKAEAEDPVVPKYDFHASASKSPESMTTQKR